MYFLALQKILSLGHPDAPSVFTEQLLELHRGQGMEIYWRDSFRCPTEEEYKKMVIQSNDNVFKLPSRANLILSKIISCFFTETGGLFMLAIRLMRLFSECRSDFRPLTEVLGLIFQIRDDYCNLADTDVSFICRQFVHPDSVIRQTTKTWLNLHFTFSIAITKAIAKT